MFQIILLLQHLVFVLYANVYLYTTHIVEWLLFYPVGIVLALLLLLLVYIVLNAFSIEFDLILKQINYYIDVDYAYELLTLIYKNFRVPLYLVFIGVNNFLYSVSTYLYIFYTKKVGFYSMVLLIVLCI